MVTLCNNIAVRKYSSIQIQQNDWNIDLLQLVLTSLIICAKPYFLLTCPLFCNFLLVGDFNVDFNNPSGHLYPHVSNLMHTVSLSQVVDSPTHYSHSGHPSLIDLAFVSNIHSLLECTVIHPLSNSDHFGLSVTLQHSRVAQQTPTRRPVWRYKYEAAHFMICDLDLEEVFVHNDIQ